LNELTIDRAKAPREPIRMAAIKTPTAASSSIAGVNTHVAAAVRSTSPRVIALDCTTESIVIRPAVGGAVGGA
jgi:hypothetical protein